MLAIDRSRHVKTHSDPNVDDGNMLPTVDHLLFSADARSEAGRIDLARRATRGELVRIVRGAYVDSSTWGQLGDLDRIRLKVVAVAAIDGGDPIVSHSAAALMWGLPWFGERSDRVDVLHGPADRGHYGAAFRRHLPGSDGAWARIDGVRVTSLARTVIDIAKMNDFTRAVVVGDSVLNNSVNQLRSKTPKLTLDLLTTELDSSPSEFALPRARDVVQFLDARAGSPGESVSRVTMSRLNIPFPELQQRFNHAAGAWFVDFWWPEYEIVGEFDGATKYLDAAVRDGRSPEEVVYEEKLREDELRRRTRGFARWNYAVAISPVRLAARLRAAGLPTRVPRSSKRIAAYELV